MGYRRSLLTGLTGLSLLLTACTSMVPATVTRHSQAPLDRSRAVWVVASRERAVILESLQEAGIRIATHFESPTYSLNVRIGRSRGQTKCGSVSNVSYVLSGEGRNLMVIKGRGPTGSCKPSIFDDMSLALANSMI